MLQRGPPFTVAWYPAPRRRAAPHPPPSPSSLRPRHQILHPPPRSAGTITPRIRATASRWSRHPLPQSWPALPDSRHTRRRRQRRNLKTNACITFFPIVVCLLIVLLQGAIDRETDKPKYRCGCACVDTAADGSCRRTECGVQYSTLDGVVHCPVPSPPRWPALVQVPRPEYRAVRTTSQPFDGLPDPTCRETGSYPAAFLVTGSNRSLAESLSGALFPSASSPLNLTDYLDTLSKIVPGSDTRTSTTRFIEPVFVPGKTLYVVQPRCLSNLSQTISFNTGPKPLQLSK